MAQTSSTQQNATPLKMSEKRSKRIIFGWVLIAIALLLLLPLFISMFLLVLNNLDVIHLSWANKLASSFSNYLIPGLGTSGGLTVLLGIIGFMLTKDKDNPSLLTRPNEPNPITVTIQLTPQLPELTSSIYAPGKIIEDIYAKLTQESITTLMLVGNPGVGKSTLSALLYEYVEEQRREKKGPFTASALWYTIDANSTISNLGQNVLSGLGKAIPNFESLPAQNQALALINALNMSAESRLIVFDQFENLFDWNRPSGFTNRPGIDEFLDALNRQEFQHSHSRVLLTSTSIPWWSSEQTLLHMQAYPVKGFDYMQGLELLKKRSRMVQAALMPPANASTEQDTATMQASNSSPQPEHLSQETQPSQNVEAILEKLIASYHGNALALTLLATFLDQYGDEKASLTDLMNNRKYASLWSGSQPLDFIYYQQLNQEQRQALHAFAIYREPAPLEAALAVDTSISVPESELTKWPLRYLLIELEIGLYQLHPATAYFIRNRFDPTSERDDQQTLRTAHAGAAEYYMHRAKSDCPPKEQRWTAKDVHAFSEAAWHYCIAGEWQKAYALMEREDLYFTLSRSGGAPILLELYQLLLPPHRWHATPLETATIYNNFGEVYAVLEKREEATRYFKEALSNLEQTQEQDLRRKGRTLHNLGLVCSAQGQELQFWGYLEEEWDSLSSAEQPLEATKQQNYRQKAAEVQQYLELATRYLEQALSLRRYVGDREGTGKTVRALGHVYSANGRSKQALVYYEQALEIARDVNDEVEIGRVLHDLGRVYNKLGKKKQSKVLEYLGQALNILHTYKDIVEEGRTRNTLGRVYYDMAKIPKAQKVYYDREKLFLAREYYQQALLIGREVGDRRGVAIALYNIGMLFFDQGQYDKMLACILLARAIIGEIQGSPWEKTEGKVLLLPKKPGKQEFEDLVIKVQPDMFSIVKSALQEDFTEEDPLSTSPYLSFSLANSPVPAATAEEPEETEKTEQDQDDDAEGQPQTALIESMLEPN